MDDKPNLEKGASSQSPQPAKPLANPPQPSPCEQAPAAQPAPRGASFQRPLIISLLYLLSIVTGFTMFVGVVLAYIWRGEETAEEWEISHFTYLIRTFWMGFGLFVLIFIGWVLAIMGLAIAQSSANEPPGPAFFVVVFGGFIVMMLGGIWFCARSVVSMVKSANRQPMSNPTTWLF